LLKTPREPAEVGLTGGIFTREVDFHY